MIWRTFSIIFDCMYHFICVTSTILHSALRTDVVSVEDVEGYVFPGDESIEGFTVPNSNLANIQLPQSLLEARANCKPHTWSEVFHQ